MNYITGQIVKPIIMIILIICCLCVTIINCDEKLNKRRSVFGANIEKPIDAAKNQLKFHDSIVTALPLNSKTQDSSVQENAPAAVKTADTITGTKKLTSPKITNSTNNNATDITPNKNTNSTTTTAKKPGISPNIQPPINSGALLRGASVFLGLSIVVVAYIIFRCARLNKSRTQMVRKYGILAHRQDVEMRPLPLDDEDEDDNTVFDASEIAAIHDKQRRMT